MSKGQNKILDVLMKEHLDVNGLIEATGLSDSFIRNSLRIMESEGQVEKVDKRVPYMYRIPPDNPMRKHIELIKAYENELLDKDAPTDTLGIFVRKLPKNDWVLLVNNMQAMAIAIQNLEREGLLLETLEA